MQHVRTSKRWLAILAAIVLFAAACGDDSGSTDAGANDDPAPSGDSDGAGDSTNDDGAGDSTNDDDSADDGSADDDSADDDSADDDSADDDAPADDDMPAGELDCAEVQNALEQAGDFAGIDPTGGSGEADLEADFAQARASLAALAVTAPEISDEVNTAVEALDGFAEVMARYGWQADFSDDPSQALAFAQELLAEGNIMEMTTAMTAISQWITTACVPS